MIGRTGPTRFGDQGLGRVAHQVPGATKAASLRCQDSPRREGSPVGETVHIVLSDMRSKLIPIGTGVALRLGGSLRKFA